MQEYIVSVSSGDEVVRHSLLAEDITHAAAQGGRLGRVLSIKKSSSLASLFRKKMSVEERIEFLQKLSQMLASKVTLPAALETTEQVYSGAVRRVAASLRSKVAVFGTDFDVVLKSMPADFPETTTSLVSAGMKSGDFHRALADAADFEREMTEIRRGNMTGLLSAIANFVIGALLILGTTYWFAPYFMSSSFMQAAESSPEMVLIMAFANVLGAIIAVVMAFVLFLFVVTFVLKPVRPALADKIILKLPIYRELALSQSHFVVFYTLSRLCDSGTPLDVSFKVVIQSAPRGAIRNDLMKALEALELGNDRWALEMESMNPIDKASLTTSRNIKDVVRSIRNVADGKKNDYARTTRRIVPILETLGYLLMACAGFLLFLITTIPTLTVMQDMM